MATSVAKNAWKIGRTPNVCVVGAGFAGLACAWRLGQHGMNVTVLEARDRVGGRVHQLKTLGHWTDMGANWLHGPDSSPIRGLAERVGAVTISPDDSFVAFDPDGELIAQSRAEKLATVMSEAWESAFEYTSEHSRDIPASKSMKDYVRERVDETDLSSEDKQTVMQMSEVWGGYIGTPYERQSLKYLFLEGSMEASTYKDILQIVADRAFTAAKVEFATKVTGIDFGASTNDSSCTVNVSIQNLPSATNGNKDLVDSSEEYDAVVVTVPFGCLQSRQIEFHPALDDKLQHAIDSVTYGTLEKVYLTFPRAFWQDQPTQSGDSSSNSSSPSPFFRQFLHPKYAEATNPQHWEIGIADLASSAISSSSTDYSQPTILFYVYGPCGTHILSLVKDLEPSDPEYLARLSEFFRPYYSRLPNYQPSNPSECEPVGALATDWQHDPLAGFGSYTNWQIDDNEARGLPPKMPLDQAVETMRAGKPENGVWFAGEHTAPPDSLGTVTGAYVSGENVAERVLEELRA